MTRQFWGFDLCQDLPRTLTSDGIVVVPGELDRVRALFGREFPSFTQEGLGMVPRPNVAAAKRRYLEEACDLIELHKDGETIAAFLGGPEDWSTYYLRSMCVAGAFQRSGLAKRILSECVIDVVRAHGVERVTGETSPVNAAMTRILLDLGFHPAGHQLTDRWGPIIRYTKFLDPECEQAFFQRYAGTAARNGAFDRKEET